MGGQCMGACHADRSGAETGSLPRVSSFGSAGDGIDSRMGQGYVKWSTGARLASGLLGPMARTTADRQRRRFCANSQAYISASS